MISFDFLPLHHVGEEILPNIARHYSEMSEGDDYGVPELDVDYYRAISQMGQCRVVTMRDDGELVGYSVFTISINPRHKNRVEAENQGFYLEKKYRGKFGRVLSNKSDDYLQSMGVNETHYTESDDRVGRVLGGYKSKYKIWSKVYGE